MGRKHRKRISQCKNCLTYLNAEENFCPKCGQENHYHNHSIKELFLDFTGSLLNFDGKVWVTLKHIFIPGKIPIEFLAGKKKSYVFPFRLYLFISFIFFLLSSMNVGDIEENPIGTNEYKISENQYLELLSQSKQARLTTITDTVNFEFDESLIDKTFKYKGVIQNIILEKKEKNNKLSYMLWLHIPEEKDSLFFASDKRMKISLKDSRLIVEGKKSLNEFYPREKESRLTNFLNNFVRRLIIHLSYKTKNEKLLSSASIPILLRYTSYSLIIMLPFVAILLFILFFKRTYKYYHSLVYATYSQCHLLTIGSIFTLLSVLIDQDWVYFLILPITLYVIIYNFIGVMRYYKVGIIRAIISSFIFTFLYGVILGLCVFGVITAVAFK